jgi:hypothetical protein
MGKETLILLPSPADARWGLEGERSWWYPSVSLLRQETSGDWMAPLARARERLDVRSRRP